MDYVILFTQPVVDAFDPRLLVAPPMFHLIDFMKIKVRVYLLEKILCFLLAIIISFCLKNNPYIWNSSVSSRIFSEDNSICMIFCLSQTMLFEVPYVFCIPMKECFGSI